MLCSCTYMATVGVKWFLSYVQKTNVADDDKA